MNYDDLLEKMGNRSERNCESKEKALDLLFNVRKEQKKFRIFYFDFHCVGCEEDGGEIAFDG